jgi:dTMP kinase
VNAGRLVAFEGLDGCGKSTQLEKLAAALRAAGCRPLVTREPSEGAWGRRIRTMARRGEPVAAEEELRWFVEDRREHVSGVIRPALASGRPVLTDRYFLSTVAYQGARGLDWQRILAESEAEFPLPDLVVLLEIEPDRGLERVRARGGALETVFERNDLLIRVAAIFRSIERDYVERVDGSGEPDAVADAVRACVKRRLGLLGGS